MIFYLKNLFLHSVSMTKSGKISVLGLILLLLLLGNLSSHTCILRSFAHTRAHFQSKTSERHFTQAPCPIGEYALGKHKIKVRFKCGESPAIDLIYYFPQQIVTFIDVVETVDFSSPILSSYSFSSSLRGPPVTFPA